MDSLTVLEAKKSENEMQAGVHFLKALANPSLPGPAGGGSWASVAVALLLQSLPPSPHGFLVPMSWSSPLCLLYIHVSLDLAAFA